MSFKNPNKLKKKKPIVKKVTQKPKVPAKTGSVEEATKKK
jgi:hypothetical protein